MAELARRHLEAGRLPQAGGVRPQLAVTVDLDSLLAGHGAVGGEAGWVGPLAPEGCRRLACDGALTRVLVSRQPPSWTARWWARHNRARLARSVGPPSSQWSR